jgi:hypothetical protein
MATGPSRIEARIESIVDPWRLRGGVRPWEAAAAAATGLVLVATLASTRPSLAQGGEIGQPAPTAVGRNGADAAADVVVGPNPGPGVGPSPRVSAKSSVLVPIGQSERVRPKAARIASGARASAIIDRVSPDLAPGDLPGRADNQRDGPDVQGADTYVAKPRARDNTPTRITGADVWTDPASMP